MSGDSLLKAFIVRGHYSEAHGYFCTFFGIFATNGWREGKKPGPWPEKLAVLFISILRFPVYAVLLDIFTILISTQYYKPESFILKLMSY